MKKALTLVGLCANKQSWTFHACYYLTEEDGAKGNINNRNKLLCPQYRGTYGGKNNFLLLSLVSWLGPMNRSDSRPTREKHVNYI